MRMKSATFSPYYTCIIIKYKGPLDNIFGLNTQVFANYITWDESYPFIKHLRKVLTMFSQAKTYIGL